MTEIKSIAIIGSGRIAHHLAPAFYKKGIEIKGIFGRHLTEVKALASRVNSKIIEDISQQIHADLVIIAVSDDAIHRVASDLSKSNEGLIVHTSGAVAMKAIPDVFRRGVMYPLQSFSPDKNIVWNNVPFCLEAENDADLNLLGSLAELLSQRVYILNSDQRKNLHLAAVFANNFANLMFEMSEELLEKNEIDRTILHPLIVETANKLLMQKASKSQTGPAARGDEETIRAHRELLGDDNTYREVYDLLTREIHNRNHG